MAKRWAKNVGALRPIQHAQFVIQTELSILCGAVVWIDYYLCNQCLSRLMLWFRISIRARCNTLCDKVCQLLVTDRWFSPGPPVSSTNKTDRHDITEILLKFALNTIKQTYNIHTFPMAIKRWIHGCPIPPTFCNVLWQASLQTAGNEHNNAVVIYCFILTFWFEKHKPGDFLTCVLLPVVITVLIIVTESKR